MRLISSSRITSAWASGPNSVMSSPVAGLIIWKPTTSVGCRSARPWSRTNRALLMAARITPKKVLPTPGTPRRSRLPALTWRCSRLSYDVGISDIRTTLASALAVSYPTSALLPSATIDSWKLMACSRSAFTGSDILLDRIPGRGQGSDERGGRGRAHPGRRHHYDGRLRALRHTRESDRGTPPARHAPPDGHQQQRRHRRF